MTELRPIYFIVVCWGERFRHYLTDFCPASFLPPTTIPSLPGGHRNKFSFGTPTADWVALQETAILKTLERYVDRHHIAIPSPPSGRSGCEHMGIGHRLAAEL